MSSKSSSSTSTLLVILILIITFPFWIAIGGVMIGLIAGLFGAVVGLLGALLGGIIALIALPFKLLFGFGSWSCDFDGGVGNAFVWMALLLFAALIVTKRKR
jgi:hypothetical protein